MTESHLLPRSVRLAPVATACLLLIAGCAPSYSPNTYASNAVQLANKVEPGIVVGFREVNISANGTIGTVVGGAAGGLLATEHTDSGLAALAGSTVGAMVGGTLQHVTNDTAGWEYIVRKTNGEMVSVTQREKKPLALGEKVLVIMGPQARVVPDYSVAQDQPPEPAKEKAEARPEPKPETPVKVEVVLSLPPGVTAQATGGQATIVTNGAVTVPVAVTSETSAPPESQSAAPSQSASADGADKPAEADAGH